MMVFDVCHFFVQRLWAVIAPKCRVKPNRTSHGFGRVSPVSPGQKLPQLAIASARFSSGGRRLVKTMIAILNTLPAFAVERNSKNDFCCRHARLQEAANSVVPIPLVQRGFGRISRSME